MCCGYWLVWLVDWFWVVIVVLWFGGWFGVGCNLFLFGLFYYMMLWVVCGIVFVGLDCGIWVC